MNTSNLSIKLLFLGLSFSTIHGRPRVSIITSVYNGDEFIEGFMEDIIKQTIFDQCELIIINANSPGHEETIIKQYMEKCPNIIYVKLEQDPGIYGAWNLAIKMARAKYITNANLDDRLKYNCYETHADYLDKNQDIDLVYSGCYITTKPNENFENNSSNGKIVWQSQQEFDRLKQLYGISPRFRPIAYPNNHAMWRRTLHEKHGLFDERYKSAGDIEMWLRATIAGNAKFKKISGIFGLYYWNPRGLSTLSSGPSEAGQVEVPEISTMYRNIYEKIFKHIEFLKSREDN